MSRPGYVFDLRFDENAKETTYECRLCGTGETDRAERSDLYARMRAHLVRDHALQNAADWKVTRQDRTPAEAAVCFWPPEAL